MYKNDATKVVYCDNEVVAFLAFEVVRLKIFSSFCSPVFSPIERGGFKCTLRTHFCITREQVTLR